MPDLATQSLNHILSSPEYVRVPGLPCFDEHDEYDAQGNLVRRFDRAALEEIARRCNARAARTGDLSPFGAGHTFDDVYDKAGRLLYKAKEEDQPVPLGFVANYRVEPYGPQGRLAVVADFHVQRQLKTADGKIVDGVAYMKSFPRRSVELWPKDGIIDWVALLRRTPERDLGLLAYAKHGARVARHAGKHTYFVRGDDGAALVPAALLTGSGKLRYAMGATMPFDPTQPPSATQPGVPPQPQPGTQAAPEMPQDEKERLSKGLFGMPHQHAQALMGHLVKRYGAECGIAQPEPMETTHAPEQYSAPAAPAAPGGSNTFIPPGPQRHQADEIPERYRKELQTAQASIAALQLRARRAEYHHHLATLNGRYEFDLAEELNDCQDMAPERFGKHCDKLKRICREKETDPTSPLGLNLEPIPGTPPSHSGPSRGTNGRGSPLRLSREQCQRAVQLVQEKQEAGGFMTIDEAYKQVAEQK